MQASPMMLFGVALLVSLSNDPSARANAAPVDEESVVAAWNEVAYEIAYAEDSFFTFKGHRAFSMMHLAMHDALNSIEPRYTRYACTAAQTDADPTAAVTQAAYEVLVTQYPDRRSSLDSALTRWLAPIPAGVRKARAGTLGRACASAILALREGDGWDFAGEYAFGDAPGRYQTTGTWDSFMLQPGFRYARPFALTSPDQFRPPPPPEVKSAAYAEAYAEAKAQGGVTSTVRTDEQTGYAVWWMEFAEGSVNRLARELVAEQGIDVWDAARLFATLNVALYDGYIAVWDSKYEYDHWRPVTAIHAAEADGNPATTPAADWEPLRPTPPFQDYASAHATACAASLGVLGHEFGDEFSFSMSPTTAPEGMPTRAFMSFSAAAEECADSRIQLGWHFRYAADEGLALGRRIMSHITSNYLLPE
ncbi:MAG: vanadium-dependent haloperoxidase [Rhodothermales bacterium]